MKLLDPCLTQIINETQFVHVGLGLGQDQV